MPALTGRPGQVVVAYLETPDIVPTTAYGKPAPGADTSSDWKVHVAQTLDLFDATPSFTNSTVTATPMHHGDICTLGIFCTATPGANRDLLDFIDAQIDPDGRAHVSFTGDYGSWNGIYAANQVSGPGVGPPGH